MSRCSLLRRKSRHASRASVRALTGTTFELPEEAALEAADLHLALEGSPPGEWSESRVVASWWLLSTGLLGVLSLRCPLLYRCTTHFRTLIAEFRRKSSEWNRRTNYGYKFCFCKRQQKEKAKAKRRTSDITTILIGSLYVGTEARLINMEVRFSTAEARCPSLWVFPFAVSL